MHRLRMLLTGAPLFLLTACASISGSTDDDYDLLITHGMIYDGTGSRPYRGDVAVTDDRIVYVGRHAPGTAKTVVRADGKAIAPGFINMLSHSQASFFIDSRLVSDIKQGVTLEVMGEGWSMGPLTPTLKGLLAAQRTEGDPPIYWDTLDEYLEGVAERGVATNIASFVGATTVRLAVLGQQDIDPDTEQLAQMRALVASAMRDGAMGLGTSLIYPPAGYSETPELIALATEAALCGGMYISHMRSEGDRIEEAVDELIEIAKQSGAATEIHHLKFAGKANWDKLPTVIAKVEQARSEGFAITGNMYPYDAGATGLTASLPLWVQADGFAALIERLQDPDIRAKVLAEMRLPSDTWENLLQLSGGTGENITLIGFTNEALDPLIGQDLAEVAAARNQSVEETILDLIIEDQSRVEAAYRVMSEDNVRIKITLPWMSFGSDAPGQATEGIFLEASAHPRTYGTFARVLGKYSRDEGLLTLEEAVRRMTSLPAGNLKLKDRGRLTEGHFADIVMFDPRTIADHATYEEPHQYASGVINVWVNGKAVLLDGEPTGVAAGRVVRGPGWTKWSGGGVCPA